MVICSLCSSRVPAARYLTGAVDTAGEFCASPGATGVALLLMKAVIAIAEKIAGNSPNAVQAVKRAVQLGYNEPVEQAVSIMMDEHWRSVIHPDRVEGIHAFTEGKEAEYPDPPF